jgi:DNA-binding IclR family transcriptional regulator
MQSADRALAILAAFTESRPEVGVSELARELGMHKSTVSRLLGTLEARGLVRRAGDRFLPGPELARLGSLAAQGLALLPVARPELARLAEETGETVNLAVRQGDRALNVHQVATAHFVGLTDWAGRATPLHATANGKVLLAYGDGGVPAVLEAITERTIVDRHALEEELERTKSRGYAQAVEELEAGLNSVAAPVFDASGGCLAAVSVAGPSYRVSEERLDSIGAACADAAGEISQALGYRKAA